MFDYPIMGDKLDLCNNRFTQTILHSHDRGYISYHEEGKWLVFTTRNGKITEIKLFDYVV